MLTNDHDPEGARVAIQSFDATTAQGGTVTKVGNALVYTPAAGFTGSDSFSYAATDPTGLVSNHGEGRGGRTVRPGAQRRVYAAATDTLVAALADGATLDAAALGSNSTFAVAVDPAGALAGKVGSVRLTLSGDAAASRTETGAPYSLFGDKDGDLKGGGLDLGPPAGRCLHSVLVSGRARRRRPGGCPDPASPGGQDIGQIQESSAEAGLTGRTPR